MKDNSTGVNYLLTGLGYKCCYPERNDFSIPGSIATPQQKAALLDAQSKLEYRLTANHNPTKAIAGFASMNVSSQLQLI